MSLTDISRSSSGVLAGPIWIAAGESGTAFPEVNWSDLPVAVLSSWIPSLRRLQRGGQAAECHFMDGPYHFTVSAATAEAWRLACFERREGPGAANAIAEYSTTPQVFLESAVGAARGILGFCDAREWWNADTDRLREAVALADPGAAS